MRESGKEGGKEGRRGSKGRRNEGKEGMARRRGRREREWESVHGVLYSRHMIGMTWYPGGGYLCIWACIWAPI
jgi:hypothetical protein